jgi:cystathionine gamma-synthase
MIFPAKDAARRFIATMKSSDSTLPVYNIRFFLLSGLNAPETEKWTSFYAVLFHKSLELAAAKFWELFGDGISSRHAAFCLARFPFLESEAVDSGPEFKSSPTNFSYNDIVLPAWMDSAINEKKLIKSLLARCVRPTCSNLKLAEEDDIYLYSTGMAAISAIARALVSLAGGAGAVVYGSVQTAT